MLLHWTTDYDDDDDDDDDANALISLHCQVTSGRRDSREAKVEWVRRAARDSQVSLAPRD